MRKEFDQPSSVEAEKAVLGGLFWSQNCGIRFLFQWTRKICLLEHQLIYRAIRRLRDHGNELDTVTLIES